MGGPTMLRARLMIAALIATFCAETAPSQAVPISSFTGHSDGRFYTVNFAVLPPGDGLISVLSPLFKPAESAPPLNDQQFTYLYQLANPNHRVSLNSFSLSDGVNATTIGSFGGASTRVDFLDQGAVVNVSGVPTSGCSFPNCAGDGPGGNLDGAKGFGIAIAENPPPGMAVAASAHSLVPGNPVAWTISSGNAPFVGSTPVFGYQSAEGPLLGTGLLSGIGPGIRLADSVFGIPLAAAPEPSTLLLLGSGLAGLWWRRKQA